VKLGLEEVKYREVLKDIFVLNKKTVNEFHDTGLPNTIISVSKELVKEFPELDVYTSLVVYKDIEILTDESALTLPLKIKELNNRENLEGRFEYQFKPMPAIRFFEPN
jgi:hypothetical protein